LHDRPTAAEPDGRRAHAIGGKSVRNSGDLRLDWRRPVFTGDVPDSSEREWVALTTRFTSGWPWPEDSYGMDPMFGSDGWCHSCGTALSVQSGPLTIQGSKFPTASLWMPNWQFDAICVAPELADGIRDRFSVELGEVHKPRGGATGVMQLLPAVTPEPWYEPRLLADAVHARHKANEGDRTGHRCDECDRWKWLPIGEGEVPIRSQALTTNDDVIASSEMFGDGFSSFRHLLFRRQLGEVLVAANRRSWSVVAVTVVDG